jgi:hypothetical protein
LRRLEDHAFSLVYMNIEEVPISKNHSATATQDMFWRTQVEKCSLTKDFSWCLSVLSLRFQRGEAFCSELLPVKIQFFVSFPFGASSILPASVRIPNFDSCSMLGESPMKDRFSVAVQRMETSLRHCRKKKNIHF